MGQAADLDAVITRMTAEFLAHNGAARVLRRALDEAGVGFVPVVDHLTIRTMDIDQRAKEFVTLGYAYDETLQYEDWFAKVYRRAGYPALFVDQAYPDDRGKTSIIPRWVQKFGDQVFHHVAVRVEDIERAILKLKAKGVVFAGEIVGARGGMLRQIFTTPEMVDGQPFSVLELAERHQGYQGFLPPQADSLMRSTVGKC
jgi:hypothetical protein